jgi:hypothetical protein
LQRTALIADPRFTVELIVATLDTAKIATNGRPLSLMSLEHPTDALVPAASGSCTVRGVETSAPFLFVTPERSADGLATRLLAAGIPQLRIDAFAKQFVQIAVAAR